MKQWYALYVFLYSYDLVLGPVFCLSLCSANHRTGYWSNLPCDWPSTAWAYSKQETENGPWWGLRSMMPYFFVTRPQWVICCDIPGIWLYFQHLFKNFSERFGPGVPFCLNQSPRKMLIDQSHNSQTALEKYPAMHHFVSDTSWGNN